MRHNLILSLVLRVLIEHHRYGAVVRSANAYVPPGARKSGATTPANGSATPSKAEIPKVQIDGPDGAAAKDGVPPASPAPGSATTNTVRSSSRLLKF